MLNMSVYPGRGKIVAFTLLLNIPTFSLMVEEMLVCEGTGEDSLEFS